ncbi:MULTISPECIES: CocE/NonD family hydrolase [unclassified Pseudomonas]|uniref:CocE/NonD family hydrolase n=1 Tax=unclassified Pseudomonas TaxID=196821 RepID=UPI0021C77E28|nr:MULTISPECIES: CocE/NonD family hydrolase [unclassified Pseudomonas]MCU1733348.1 CocE/NonD family hydrolase [Pseudomonas sp. 20P_3.2_Bac4]MCU1743911.1 CocE/NonD family hydrolase [Pseudomonas sp. 20P_3.2_Bac5]
MLFRTTAMAASLAAATLLGGTAYAAQDIPGQDVSSAPARQWQPFWAKRETGYIKTADGTELRYSALLPANQGRFPVLVRYSGYDSGSIGGSAYLADDETFSVDLDKQLVSLGYAVVGVQARGTGCSQGTFDFLGPAYGTDGRDAIEFIAKQTWSDGKVGMFGWSWSGMSQLMTAAERPASLKAIAPGMVLGDARGDSWAPGGVPAPEFVTGWHWYLDQRWAAVKASATSENDSRCLSQLAKNKADIGKHALTYQLIRHPLRDEWVNQRNLRDRTHLIQVPILSFEAWQDEAVMAREGYYHETVRPEQLWTVQSNGPHDLYESRHFRDKLVAFFDHFVKGQDNDFNGTPHVEIWQETASAQRDTPHDLNETATPGWTLQRERLPLDITPVRFALVGGGKLIEGGKPEGEPDEYAYPVAGPDVNTYEEDNAWGQLKPGWEKGSLAYTSAPLTRDLLSYGPGSADLWLSTPMGPDLDVQVTLTQLLPDGQEVFIQRGWLRMSARKLDDGKSTALRPWRLDTPDAVEPMLPDTPVLGRVEIPPFSHPLRAGSRVRLWIDAPGRTGGYGFDTFALPAKPKLLHDAQHPSTLVLGELKGVQVPAAQPACDSLLKQPCRPDPLNPAAN